MDEREFIMRELGYLEAYDNKSSQIPPDRMAEYAKLIESISRRYFDETVPDILFMYEIVALFSTEDCVAACFDKDYSIEIIERREQFFDFLSFLEEYFFLSHDDAYNITIPIIIMHFKRIMS